MFDHFEEIEIGLRLNGKLVFKNVVSLSKIGKNTQEKNLKMGDSTKFKCCTEHATTDLSNLTHAMLCPGQPTRI